MNASSFFVLLLAAFLNDSLLCSGETTVASGVTVEEQRMLLEAAANGNLDRVRDLLDTRPAINVNWVDQRTLMTPCGWVVSNVTALLRALHCRQGDAANQLEIVRLLISRGADINARETANNYTALMMACANATMHVVKLLFEKGADINAAKGANNWSALMSAVSGDQTAKVDLITYLLEKGAQINEATNDGVTVLMIALQNYEKNSVEVIRLLLDRGADVNAQDSNGRTPLIWLVASAKKATPFSTGNARDYMPLLLQRKADVSVRDKNGWAPLMFVIENSGDMDLIQFLLDIGEDLEAKDSKGMTPLMLAVQNDAFKLGGTKNLVSFLLDKGAVLQAKDRIGMTPLHYAANYNQGPEITQMLVERGANIEAMASGWPPLLWAADVRNVEIVRYLLMRGADKTQCINFLTWCRQFLEENKLDKITTNLRLTTPANQISRRKNVAPSAKCYLQIITLTTFSVLLTTLIIP